MKTRHLFFLIALLVSAATSTLAASPQNDNFANATPLSGSSITFTGTLVGATYESPETNSPNFEPYFPCGSVWWTWTAPQSSTVIMAPQQAFPQAAGFAYFCVYSGTDIVSLSGLAEVSWSLPRGRYGSFPAMAGQTYKFRVYGNLTQPFSVQVIATNPPVFVVQPHDCVVSPHGSAFFGAISTGNGYYPGFPSYQWTFNGTPIPGQIYPSLLVHDVTTNNVGTYSVISSNADGLTVSTTAQLILVDTNPVPQLRASKPTTSNSLPFTLTGEPGRWYQIQSSADLQTWVNPAWLQPTNANSSLSVSRLGPVHFIRASLNTPTDVCVAQLKQMLWAQYAFTIYNNFSTMASYSLVDLLPFVPRTSLGTLYPCPEGGYYSASGTVLDPPTCNLPSHGHVINDLP